YSIEDACGNITYWRASLTTIDTSPPTIILPQDTVFYDCDDPVPPAPSLIAVDTSYDIQLNFPGPVPGDTLRTIIDTIRMEFSFSRVNVSQDTLWRIWIFADSCANTDTVRQFVIRLDDPPVITLPFLDTTITCANDLAGLPPPIVVDDCDPNPILDLFSETVKDSICRDDYTLERIWQAKDSRNNIAISLTQVIRIKDTIPIQFTFPEDTVIADRASLIELQKIDTISLIENCSSDTTLVGFQNDNISGMPGSEVIVRSWVIDTVIGCQTIDTTLLWTITVRDTLPPMISTPANDTTIYCEVGTDLDSIYRSWYERFGGAIASDNYTLDGNLNWFIQYSDNGVPVNGLPDPNCNPVDSAQRIYNLAVDFIVQDERGNRDTSSATFMVFDTIPPAILNCTNDTISVSTDTLDCLANFTLFPPVVEENCSLTSEMIAVADSIRLTYDTSQGAPGDVPVDTVHLSIPIPLPLDISSMEATLEIQLRNVDAEQLTEFFSIYGEGRTFLGRTRNTLTQCNDTSLTTITLTSTQVETWAVDGRIDLVLEPNVPEGLSGRSAVNAICDNGNEIHARLSFESKGLENLRFEYVINDGDTAMVNPVMPITLQLPEGINKIAYYISDCAGNVDSCMQWIEVIDNIPPTIDCPTDIVVVSDPDTCVATITLPLPDGASDNCAVIGQFEQIVPSDTSSAFFTFTNDPNLNDFLANNKEFVFNGVSANAVGQVTLTFNFKGNFNDVGAFVRFYDENGNEIGRTNLGDASCNTEGQTVMTFTSDEFNTWATDGVITFLAEVNDIQVPPGIPGDGINPCGPIDTLMDGSLIDSMTYMFAKLEYGELQPSYFSQGATEIPLTQMQAPVIRPTHLFDVGTTEVFYTLEDINGNEGMCSFTITVEDRQSPLALCQPTTIFINPSGLDEQTVDAASIDAGSWDNCGISSMTLSPNTFDCKDAGDTTLVTLRVEDISGNISTCETIVRVETLKPSPNANSGLCGSDTLFLFAAPPPAQGGIIYTYEWTGPNGFTSNLQDPIIPNVDSDNAGSYTVEVTGITGCSSKASIEVSIEDLPLTPGISGTEDICVTDDIVLNSNLTPTGANVAYNWYRGQVGSGILLASTSSSRLTIPGPHNEGINDYYLEIQVDGCISKPSTAFSVRTNAVPLPLAEQTVFSICEGQELQLRSNAFGDGITYQWAGPDGFSSTNQAPLIEEISISNGGSYELTVFKNSCPSEIQDIEVVVLERPAQPLISSSAPVCEGDALRLRDVNRTSMSYTWFSPARNYTSGPEITIVESEVSESGLWRTVARSEAGCESEVSEPINIVISPRPIAVASVTSESICEDQAVTLQGSPSIVNADYNWTGPGGYESGQQNSLISNVQLGSQGTYYLEIVTEEGCVSIDSVQIEVLQNPVITALSSNARDCQDGPEDVTLSASVFHPTSTSFTYNWTGPNGFTSNEEEATIIRATSDNNGTYSLIVTDQNGCESAPRNTQLIIGEPPTPPTTPSLSQIGGNNVCEGDLVTIETNAYSGNQVFYNWSTPFGVRTTTSPSLVVSNIRTFDAGEYTVFVTVDGCDSQTSGILNLNVNEKPEIGIVTNSPVCEGNDIELLTNVFPGAEYRWAGPGFTSSVPRPLIENVDSVSNTGVYSVIVSLNGCESEEVSSFVEVNSAPASPNLLPLDPICLDDEDPVVLSLDSASYTPNAMYLFEDPFGNVTERDTTFLVLDLGNGFTDGFFEFRVRSQLRNCISDYSETVEVQINTIPESRAFAGDDREACEGEAIQLQAAAPGVGMGSWTAANENAGNLILSNPNNPNSNVSGIAAGQIYELAWTLSNGACINYDSDTLIITTSSQEAAFAGEDLKLCGDRTTILEAIAPSEGVGTWTQPEAQNIFGVTIEDVNDPNTVIRGLQPGNIYSFTWTIDGGCGESNDNVLIVVTDPQSFAGFDQVVCNDLGAATLNAEDPVEGSFGEWIAPEFVEVADEFDAMTEVRNLREGNNMFIWQLDDNLCGDRGRDTVYVFYKRNPIAVDDNFAVPFGQIQEFSVLTNDTILRDSSVSILSPPSNGTLVEITEGVFQYKPDANFVGTDQFTYELCSNTCECSVATVTLEVGGDAECVAPNIITPNNDGINDTFVVPCLLNVQAFAQSRVFIFNQWGDEVFRSERPYNNDFNGTFNGEDLPVGTYFYIIELDENTEPMKGYFYIHR
ncbi:MAG: gliding motility-associated C-terminal domain-containing protein, partial [Bacteroidota bacterium]